jgi:redox-sensing transcriptional repressor
MNMEKKIKLRPPIPEVVLERLALYHCLLQDWLISGRTEPVTSREISQALNLTDETVRRDLSFLETSTGKPGVGYEINELFEVIGEKLAMESRLPVLFIGSLRMVDALLGIFSLEKFGFTPEGFFSENPGDAGKLFRGFRVKSLLSLSKDEIPRGVRLAIIATSPEWTQHAIEKAAECGIKGILNLTPMVVSKIPRGVELVQLRYPCYLKILAYKTNPQAKEG